MAEKTEAWNPVVDCIGPLIEALNPLKFSPPLYSCPDLAETYRQLDVEMCCLWLQECMNPATAADFKHKLDSCLHHWAALVSPEQWSGRWGWNFQQWQDWLNESKDNLWWKEAWDEITDEFEQTIEYLQKLAALIEAKVATRKRKGPGVDSSVTDQPVKPLWKALMLLREHPEWTDTRIAKEIGVSRTMLYEWPDYKQAREIIKSPRQDIPHGRKDAEAGKLEAWDKD